MKNRCHCGVSLSWSSRGTEEINGWPKSLSFKSTTKCVTIIFRSKKFKRNVGVDIWHGPRRGPLFDKANLFENLSSQTSALIFSENI